jgi:hypothetical protein
MTGSVSEHSINCVRRNTLQCVFATNCETGEEIMKRLLMATMLTLATTGTTVWAQDPAHDAHHPPQAATPAQPAPPSTQSGMGGMGMMNMMGGGASMMNMMGMMRMMGMAGSGMGGMATIDRVEGRIAFLRTELKISEAQTSAWDAFADALRANGKKLGQARGATMTRLNAEQQAPTLADRLALQEQWLAARLEGTRAIRSAVTTLYGVLSDDQKKTANELLAPHMGMMAMMSGQPGMMQPGQMPRGPMMPGPMMRQQVPQPEK